MTQLPRGAPRGPSQSCLQRGKFQTNENIPAP
jgi:hypothetical protein